MKNIHIEPLTKPFNITIDNIASDKSISHRCAMFALLSDRPSHVKNFLTAEDTLNTLSIVEQLGAVIERDGSTVKITPPKKLVEPSDILDCGNSGTAMRLFCGFLSSLEGSFVLTGDKYLNQRPMNRVSIPLKSIGSQIDGRENGNKAPLFIKGASLNSFTYESPVDSAQVKSAMILAALRAKGPSKYKETELTRDHTERMLKGMGAKLKTNDEGYIEITPLSAPLNPLDITVPTDPSSAFFFAVAAAIVPGSSVTIKNVTLNPTRIEAYKILQNMGADVEFIQNEDIYEPIGNIIVKHNKLEAVVVDKNISWLIDELPALSIAMSQAKGTSTIKNAHELRVKESDRIKSVVNNLDLCGVKYNEFEDGYEVIGSKLSYAKIDSHGDHRIAMSFAIAGLLCGMDINDTDCILTSFPNFEDLLNELKQ